MQKKKQGKEADILKKVSVVISCFHGEKWLPKCFLSLAGQTIGIHNLELIFVNDSGEDNGRTWGLLQEIRQEYPLDVVLVDVSGSRKAGGAKNEGMKYATGEYLSFVDADDWVEPDLYEKAYHKAKAEGAELVEFNYSIYENREEGKIPLPGTRDKVVRISGEEERKQFLIFGGITCGCCNKLFLRELIERAGVRFAEETVYEEPLFVYPLYFYISCLAALKDSLYIYRLNTRRTILNYMKDENTLLEHPKVQQNLWDFMKKTEYFQTYYEEIKFYYLHTYLFETLYFAKLRGFDTSLELFEKLAERVKSEVRDYDTSVYADCIPEKMLLYKKIREGGMTEGELKRYIDTYL